MACLSCLADAVRNQKGQDGGASFQSSRDGTSEKTGLTRTAEDLLTISKADEPDQVTDVHTLLNQDPCLVLALEYLNISVGTRGLQVHFDT